MTRLIPVLLTTIGLSVAVPVAGQALTQVDRAELARAEIYLNEMKSVQSRFVQSSSNGDFAQGRLYIQRPKRLRLDYDAPSTLQVYANGDWLLYVDTELEEVTHIPLDRTTAGFLVGKTVSFSDGVIVARVERTVQRLYIHVIAKEEPEAGAVILAFDRDPLRLIEWTVIDTQGIRTLVALVEPRFNEPIAGKVFEFDLDRFSGEMPN